MSEGLRRIWILGAGKFGRISAEALLQDGRKADLKVVDTDPARLEQMSDLPLERIKDDGVAFLTRHLTPEDAPDWVIPVIPLHVALEWIAARLAETNRVDRLPVPDAVVDRLPSPMRGPKGDVYASLADFVCPQDCPQPAARCTHTGKPRPYNLYERLTSLSHAGFRSIVVISRQLAPGVGGLHSRDLFAALGEAAAGGSPLLVSTACRCHGVVGAIGMSRRDQEENIYDNRYAAHRRFPSY